MRCLQVRLQPPTPDHPGGNPGDLPVLQIQIGQDFWQKALDFILCMANHTDEIFAFFNAIMTCAATPQGRPRQA